MRPGELISGFMKRIGRADRVIVVLSDKYLHSPCSEESSPQAKDTNTSGWLLSSGSCRPGISRSFRPVSGVPSTLPMRDDGPCAASPMMAERGILLAHTTILRWVQRYVPDFEKRWLAYAQPVGDSWRVDETYIKVRGQ